MESNDRELIGLKLILLKFRIDIRKSLNIDFISSCICLLQILQPLGYKFNVIIKDKKYKIRSIKLLSEVKLLQEKINNGRFVFAETQHKLNKKIEEKIGFIINQIAPSSFEVPFSSEYWIFFIGLYNIISRHYDQDTVTNILMCNYVDMLPYIDTVEEIIGSMQYT